MGLTIQGKKKKKKKNICLWETSVKYNFLEKYCFSNEGMQF